MSIFNEQINSVTLALKEGFNPPEALNRFLVGSNGFFKQVESDIVVIRHKVASVPDLLELQEGATVKIDPIPFKLFLKIRMFFKKIYEEFKTESTICVMQDLSTKKYTLFVPDQVNASTTSNYKLGDSPRFLKELKTKKLIMVCHSHPWASSSTSPSGTDNNDEKEPILYMILSNVEKIPVYYLSTCDGDKRIQVPFFHVWENPIATIFTSAEANAEDSLIVAKLFSKLNVSDILETCVNDVDIPYDKWKKFTSRTLVTNGTGNTGNQWWNNPNYNRGYGFNRGQGTYDWRANQIRQLDPGTSTTVKQTSVLRPMDHDKKKQTVEDKYDFVLRNSSEEVQYSLEAGEYTFHDIDEMYERLQNDTPPTVDDWPDLEDAEDVLNKIFQDNLPQAKERLLIDNFLDEHLNRDICFDIDLSDISDVDKKMICFHYFKNSFQYSYKFAELSNIEKVLGIFQYIDSYENTAITTCFDNFEAAYETMAEYYVGNSLLEEEALKIVKRFDLDTVYENIEKLEMYGAL